MPLAAANENSANFFLPEFIQRFLPDRATIASLLDHRWFSRLRCLSLEIILADAILDRLVHNAYKIKLKGESMRKWYANHHDSDTMNP